MMKVQQLILPLLLIALSYFQSCAPKPQQFLEGVTYVSESSTSDIAAFQGTGSAKKEDFVAEDAAKRILRKLLLEGIPNSPYRSALLSDQKLIEQHRVYLENLLENSYSRFISQVALVNFPYRASKREDYKATASVKIDIRNLKNILREQGVMPRFGL